VAAGGAAKRHRQLGGEKIGMAAAAARSGIGASACSMAKISAASSVKTLERR
jgi:hypothetical protein